MSPEGELAPKPEERIVGLKNEAIPLLRRKAVISPWLVALMSVATDSRTGNELLLSNHGQWLWRSGSGFDLLDSFDEVLLMYGRIVDRSHSLKFQLKSEEDILVFLRRTRREDARYLGKNREKLTQRFANDLETAVQKLTAS